VLPFAPDAMTSIETIEVSHDLVKYAGRPDVPCIDSLPILAGCGHEIISSKLFLGPKECCDEKALQALREANVTGIVNCTQDIDCYHESTVEYCRVPVRDEDDAQICLSFESALKFIHRHIDLENGAVVVHCRQGVSRSASIVLAFLIRFRSMSLEDAYRLAKAKRSKVNPNIGFWRQLQEFERSQKDVEVEAAEIIFDHAWAEQSCVQFAARDADAFKRLLLMDVADDDMKERSIEAALDFVFGRGTGASDIEWFLALLQAIPVHPCEMPVTHRVRGLLDETSEFMQNWKGEVTERDLNNLLERFS